MWQNYDNPPELLFVGSPDELKKPIQTVSGLSVFLLKYRPKCKCGKEFRSSGLEKAQAQIAKHKSYKKYANCNPEIEEFDYKDAVPQFVTLDQVKGTDANRRRNDKLDAKVHLAKEFEELKTTTRLGYQNQYKYDSDVNSPHYLGVIYDVDNDLFFNTNNGEQIFPPKITLMDNYQIERGINIKGTIGTKGQTRSVKSGTLKVCEITFVDEKGAKIPMTLWNDQIATIQEGDQVVIKNAYVKKGQYWAGRGFGYASRTELGLYKNASTMEVVRV